MKFERDHGDHFWLPADDVAPQDPSYVDQKQATYVQTRRGVIDYPVSAEEYYSRMAYDFLDESRGQAPNTGVDVVIDFGRIVKVLWIKCPTGSASSLFVNFNRNQATNAAGNIQIVAAEERIFFLPVRIISLSSDGVGIADFRVTWGY